MKAWYVELFIHFSASLCVWESEWVFPPWATVRGLTAWLYVVVVVASMGRVDLKGERTHIHTRTHPPHPTREWHLRASGDWRITWTVKPESEERRAQGEINLATGHTEKSRDIQDPGGSCWSPWVSVSREHHKQTGIILEEEEGIREKDLPSLVSATCLCVSWRCRGPCGTRAPGGCWPTPRRNTLPLPPPPPPRPPPPAPGCWCRALCPADPRLYCPSHWPPWETQDPRDKSVPAILNTVLDSRVRL